MKQDVADIFRERWEKMHSPLHSVGYMLEPQFQDADFALEVSLWVVPLHNCMQCYSAHDAQVRKDFREAMKRMLPKSDYVAVMSQHTKFTNKEGIFGDPDIMSLTRDDSEHAIPTYQFWMEHGKLMSVLH